MKRVDVVGAVLFDDGHDVLAQTGEDRSNRDRRHHSNHDPQHGQEAAKLVRAHAVERHHQRFSQNTFWKLSFIS